MIKIMFIFVLFTSSIYAQNPDWQPIDLEPKIEIKSSAIDTLGFIWFIDDSDLYKFDGLEARKIVSLDNENISSLRYTTDNKLALGTNLGRLILYDPYTFTEKILYDQKNLWAITSSVVIDDNNFLLVSYGNGLIISVDGDVNNISNNKNLLSTEIYECILFKNKYFISSDQGIQVINPLDSNLIEREFGMGDGLSDIVITNMVVHENELWYTDYNHHIGKISGDSIFNYELPVISKINAIVSYSQDLYIATKNGMFQFSNDKFAIKQESDSKVIQMDEEGNMWLVESSGRLLKGNMFFQRINIPFNDSRAIEYYNGNIILGNEDGLYEYKNSEFSKIITANVTCMLSFKDYLIVGTFANGIKIFDKDYNQLSNLSSWNEIEDESILAIATKNEFIFISSLSGVASFLLENNTLKPIISYNSFIGQAYVYSLLFDEDHIYFGTDRDGLYLLEKGDENVLILDRFNDGDKIGSVYSICSDAYGKIWFTSSEYGIGYLENNVAVKFSNLINYKEEYTSLIMVDIEDLLLVNPNSIDILNFNQNHIRSYGEEIGLRNNITYLNNIIKVDEDYFLVHGNELYVYKHPSSFKILTEILIEKKTVNLSAIGNSQNSFSQDENNFEFDFRGSWLSDPQKIRYQFKLEGFDAQWRETKDNSVSYPKLPPNEYVFKVRASESNNFINEPEAHYKFTILKHFYNLWWVKSIALLIIMGVLYLAAKQRNKRKKERLALERLNVENQLINLKNQLNPHFLFNSFNTLLGLIEEDQDRSLIFVEKMSDFYRKMLEYGKLDLIPLNDEIEVLNLYVDILKSRFKGQLKLIFNWDESNNLYLIPPLTLQLLLENAIKHNVFSTKDPLELTITKDAETIIVKNKRVPMTKKQSSTNTGLNNIKSRFRLVNLPVPEIIKTDEYFQVNIKLKDESYNTRG